MINSFYPSKSQPILFIYLYALHLFVRTWSYLWPFLLGWSLLDYFLVSGRIFFIPHTYEVFSFVIQTSYVIAIVITCLAWYWLTHQMKYISDIRRSNYRYTTKVIFKKSLAVLILEILTYAVIIIGGVLLVFPGIYLFVSFLAFKNVLYFIQERAMCDSLISSAQLARGAWFSIVFVLILPIFILFALCSLTTGLFPVTTTLSPVMILPALCLLKNLIFMPFYSPSPTL